MLKTEFCRGFLTFLTPGIQLFTDAFAERIYPNYFAKSTSH